MAYQVKNGFQSLPFKRNLQRYASAAAAAVVPPPLAEQEAEAVGGRCFTLNHFNAWT
jgi:hypothetical protein